MIQYKLRPVIYVALFFWLRLALCFQAAVRPAHTRLDLHLSSQRDPASLIQQSSDSTTSRREWLETTTANSAAVLSSMILGLPTASLASEDLALAGASKPSLIVITGANSGIGFEACKRLIAQGHTIVAACRTMEKAQSTVDRIMQNAGYTTSPTPGSIIPGVCDLSSLQSIRDFAAGFSGLVGGDERNIDALCLNAGYCASISQKEITRTRDGFELTGE
jgi:short chain dehydrogenase